MAYRDAEALPLAADPVDSRPARRGDRPVGASLCVRLAVLRGKWFAEGGQGVLIYSRPANSARRAGSKRLAGRGA